jgi:hypothetical protein
MFGVKRKRFGRSRHLSTAKSLTGITVLLALGKSKRGTMARLGLSKNNLTTKKGNRN